MNTIPDELLLRIIDELNAIDLGAFRSTCTCIARVGGTVIEDRFGNTLKRTRDGDPVPSSVEEVLDYVRWFDATRIKTVIISGGHGLAQVYLPALEDATLQQCSGDGLELFISRHQLKYVELRHVLVDDATLSRIVTGVEMRFQALQPEPEHRCEYRIHGVCDCRCCRRLFDWWCVFDERRTEIRDRSWRALKWTGENAIRDMLVVYRKRMATGRFICGTEVKSVPMPERLVA